MPAIINADDGAISGASGLKLSSDTSGALNIQTNGVTAIAISASQAVSFPATTSLNFTSANITTLTSSSATITNLLATTLTVSSVGIFPAGSASSAAITTAGDTNTGIFFPAADTIAFTEGGTEVLRLNSSAQVAVNTAGTAAAPVITKTDDLNTGIFFPAADTIAFAEGGVEAMRLDSAGNMGLGVTPSAWGSFYPAIEANPPSAFNIVARNNDMQIGANYYQNNSFQNLYAATGQRAAKYTISATTSQHAWYVTSSVGTAGNTISFTQAMTLNASGNLFLGTTSAIGAVDRMSISGGNLTVSRTSGIQTLIGDNTQASYVGSATNHAFVFLTNGTERARITNSGEFLVNSTTGVSGFGVFLNTASYLSSTFSSYTSDGLFSANARPTAVGTPSAATLRFGYQDDGGGQYNPAIGFRAGSSLGTGQTDYSNIIWTNTTGNICFGTGTAGSYTERARITSGGQLLVGTTTGTGRVRVASSDNLPNLWLDNLKTSGNEELTRLTFSNFSPNNAQCWFIYANDSTTQRFEVRSNGGIANYQANDVNLSDQRVKTEIKPVGSYWNKIKALEIVAFKYKDQTHDDDNIGVIAQQVESVAPEFIDTDGFGETPEDGVPLKTVYTTDMYHAAIKALQEAMARIESLEAKVAALESK